MIFKNIVYYFLSPFSIFYTLPYVLVSSYKKFKWFSYCFHTIWASLSSLSTIKHLDILEKHFISCFTNYDYWENHLENDYFHMRKMAPLILALCFKLIRHVSSCELSMKCCKMWFSDSCPAFLSPAAVQILPKESVHPWARQPERTCW